MSVAAIVEPLKTIALVRLAVTAAKKRQSASVIHVANAVKKSLNAPVRLLVDSLSFGELLA